MRTLCVSFSVQLFEIYSPWLATGTGTTMQMVHVEGNDVVPYPVSDFRIAPGETYDVLI